MGTYLNKSIENTTLKTKKIRGHRRRWKDIDYWVEANRELDLDELKANQRNYAKIWVRPWSGISITNSQIPAPYGETKLKILGGLIKIYDSWQQQLDQLGESYCLQIWLFEPRFSMSQVVCAIGDYTDFYTDTFFNPIAPKQMIPLNYGRLATEIAGFNWSYRLDEDHWDNNEPGSPDLWANQAEYEAAKKWFRQLMKKPHRTTKPEELAGTATEFYSFKKGAVWLGEKY
ncbi:hypothetical protein [Mangrovibacterium diazotrophicum]|uniref:Uncharacterized protein n=1 Tax=Mangrovibacterium diazotrophicum TaxID=1261403 RepID=A0A419W4U6_9BACT|nr:hypothetical protein [Mangrovibacterium diazotrophicum]RKD90473.1 hypothetical protein BC643_0813 [Mangrovibacterium diazotrophicum]